MTQALRTASPASAGSLLGSTGGDVQHLRHCIGQLVTQLETEQQDRQRVEAELRRKLASLERQSRSATPGKPAGEEQLQLENQPVTLTAASDSEVVFRAFAHHRRQDVFEREIQDVRIEGRFSGGAVLSCTPGYEVALAAADEGLSGDLQLRAVWPAPKHGHKRFSRGAYLVQALRDTEAQRSIPRQRFFAANAARVALEVIDRLSGTSLHDVMAENPVMPPCRAFSIVDALMGSVEACHDAGVAHLGLCPEAVWVEEEESMPTRVILLDWGTGKVTRTTQLSLSRPFVDQQGVSMLTETPELLRASHSAGAVGYFAEASKRICSAVPFCAPEILWWWLWHENPKQPTPAPASGEVSDVYSAAALACAIVGCPPRHEPYAGIQSATVVWAKKGAVMAGWHYQQPLDLVTKALALDDPMPEWDPPVYWGVELCYPALRSAMHPNPATRPTLRELRYALQTAVGWQGDSGGRSPYVEQGVWAIPGEASIADLWRVIDAMREPISEEVQVIQLDKMAPTMSLRLVAQFLDELDIGGRREIRWRHHTLPTKIFRADWQDVFASRFEGVAFQLCHTLDFGAAFLRNMDQMVDVFRRFSDAPRSPSAVSMSGVGLSSDACRALSQCKALTSKIQVLDASSNSLTYAGCTHLAAGLKTSPMVQLNLSRNSICVQGAMAIAELLATETTQLQVLDLSHNCICGGAAYIARSCRKNRSLQALVLRDNGISDADVPDFRFLSENSSLTLLDLAANSLTGHSIADLLEQTVTSALQVLDCSDNCIAPAAVGRIMEVLFRGLGPCQLMKFDIRQSNFGSYWDESTVARFTELVDQMPELPLQELRVAKAVLAPGSRADDMARRWETMLPQLIQDDQECSDHCETDLAALLVTPRA